jgi:phage tail protein X
MVTTRINDLKMVNWIAGKYYKYAKLQSCVSQNCSSNTESIGLQKNKTILDNTAQARFLLYYNIVLSKNFLFASIHDWPSEEVR